jgi:hypothetical protein
MLGRKALCYSPETTVILTVHAFPFARSVVTVGSIR